MVVRKVLDETKKNYLKVSDLFTSTFTTTYQFILQQVMLSNIRRAMEKDFETVLKIYFDEENNYYLNYNPMKKEEFRKIWNDMVARKHTYVCEMLGDVIGFISASSPEGQGQHVAHITPIVVRKEFRGFGVSKKLMRYILKKLREEGFKRVDLEVNADNKRGIKFFKKFGFEREATMKKNVKKGGRYYDDYLMVKFF
ncbi:MAG: GNAT family N-acetyltransferase [Candidatus Aenigmatarchaeota archaeon]